MVMLDYTNGGGIVEKISEKKRPVSGPLFHRVCRERDLNPHRRNAHKILNLACLPNSTIAAMWLIHTFERAYLSNKNSAPVLKISLRANVGKYRYFTLKRRLTAAPCIL
jgi:hypothetical protein